MRLRSAIDPVEVTGAARDAIEPRLPRHMAISRTGDLVNPAERLALDELERGLGMSEKLSLRLENARIHYLLGVALRGSGKTSEANAQLAQARQLLEEIRKEPGADHIGDRSDLKSIFAVIDKTAA